MYCIRRPTECRSIVGIDHQGSVYVLCSLSVVSPEVEQWGVYCFRPHNPDGGVILARLNIWPDIRHFRGSGFDRENKRLAVTQIYENNNINNPFSLQLDIVDLDNGNHTTRTCNVQDDQHLHWNAATPYKQGWVCIASGVNDEDPPGFKVHHCFWLLDEDRHPKLLTELVQATPLGAKQMAANVNGKFYCIVTTPEWRCFVFVSSWEQPQQWQPFEMAPYPDGYPNDIHYEWGHVLTSGRIWSRPTGKLELRDALFKLRFEGVDCYLEPYLILPKGVLNWKLGNGVFVAFTEGEKLTFFGIQPPALKTRALMDVVKLLNGEEKLTQLLGKATNAIRN